MTLAARRRRLPDPARQLLQIIVDRANSGDVPPSIRELGRAIGVATPTAHKYIVALEFEGLIELDHELARTIRPTGGVPCGECHRLVFSIEEEHRLGSSVTVG